MNRKNEEEIGIRVMARLLATVFGSVLKDGFGGAQHRRIIEQ